MTTKIEIRTFSTMPELATEGWDPNACSGGDYETPRARALYEALGVDPSDEEYALAQHTDGRWALFGLSVEGHRFAVEAATTLRAGVSGTFDYRGLLALLAPVAWQGTVPQDERRRQETDLAALVSEARMALDASGGHEIEIKDGEIVATIHD